MSRFRRFIPDREAIENNRWLRWLGPSLANPRLWHMSRRGLALGTALGVFFGFLIPIAQIPVSAAFAVAMRANVPAAVASTLVTNPITFGPVYYAAWKLGGALLDEDIEPLAAAYLPGEFVHDPDKGWIEEFVEFVTGVGKPLVLGLAVMAVSLSLLSYFLMSWIWTFRVRRKRRRRLAQGPVLHKH